MTTPFITIVNPTAGGGRCGKVADRYLERLRRAGLRLEVHRTSRAGEASEIARRAWSEGHRRFLAVGGDGTSYEVINGLFPYIGCLTVLDHLDMPLFVNVVRFRSGHACHFQVTNGHDTS